MKDHWNICPGCGGKPMIAYGYNPITLDYTVPEEVEHVCPTRAERGDYSFCICCATCLKARAVCGRAA